MHAPSSDAIKAKYPELLIADSRPQWLDEEHFQRMRSEPLWLDSPPTGLLLALLAERSERKR
jgi:hypothetical protein